MRRNLLCQTSLSSATPARAAMSVQRLRLEPNPQEQERRQQVWRLSALEDEVADLRRRLDLAPPLRQDVEIAELGRRVALLASQDAEIAELRQRVKQLEVRLEARPMLPRAMRPLHGSIARMFARKPSDHKEPATRRSAQQRTDTKATSGVKAKIRTKAKDKVSAKTQVKAEDIKAISR